MNKTAIKNYAIWARVQLIEAAKQKAYEYAVTDGENMRELSAINDRPLSESEKRQRRKLLEQIKLKGYQQVMEEAAYTWFNRFIALRFMEVNGYLPSRVRVFTDETGAFKPEILKEAMTVELHGLDRAKVLDLLDRQDNDALYQYLLITQCNALNECLPQMFERIDNWTELLFPKNLLRPDGILSKMISMIPEEDWTDQVQIIGWLYQYYNTEPKDKVFENLKKNIKISKENIPAATQLFTPDWIVHYMVENSLGRLWVEGHPNEEMKKSWKYYLEEAEQEPEVQNQLAEIRKEYAKLNPEDIKVIDPCMGSGHILVVMFDVLLQIYESCGYSAREAVSLIVEKNLYGLDIDERAAQLAYFAVMMKARQHDRRFFTRGIQPRVYAIRESNSLDRTTIDYFVNRNPKLKAAMETLTRELYDAKEYGSILNVSMVDFPALYARFEEIKRDNNILSQFALIDLLPFVQIAEAMAQKYDVVITNPPYMAIPNCSAKMANYITNHFSNSRYDLFGVFIDKCTLLTRSMGFRGMVTQQSWLTLGSYEDLRLRVLNRCSFSSLLQIGYNSFPELNSKVAQGVAFVTRGKLPDYKGTYYDLNTSFQPSDDKERAFEESVAMHRGFYVAQEAFNNLPGKEIIFSFVESIYRDYQSEKKINDYGLTRLGMTTADNARFTRLWYEIDVNRLIVQAKNTEEVIEKNKKWVPYNKGGQSIKWYGNLEWVLNWENDGYEIINIRDDKGRIRSTVPNTDYYFKPCLTWSKISWNIAFRYRPEGSIFDVAGASLFPRCNLFCLMGFLNSNTVDYLLSRLSPTLNFEGSHIGALPVKASIMEDKRLEGFSIENVNICKEAYDDFETSWDYKRHPLVPIACEKKEQENSQWGKDRMESFGKIEWHYNRWQEKAEARFYQLKANEEELNRIVLEKYGLKNELTPEVHDKDLTVQKADLQREIRSLMSYAVGCMFGRYSLDVPGLVYAGGAWDASKYQTFIPDEDAILPICDDEYFEDDIVGRFVKFIEAAYGKDSLEENLKFIADALGGKGTPRQVIRSYFLNDFYADHLKIYQKRPIYWLFDSGKKNSFKCLIYLHRYQPDTIARIRTDYVHEQQERYRSQIQMMEDALQTASTAERVKLNKQLAKFKDQALELQKYEEKIHRLADQAIAIDLDDGVKVNYAKFEDVLAKIK